MSDSLRTAADFAAAGLLARDHVRAIEPVLQRYSAAMTAPLAALVDRADPADPIRRQFVPDPRELATTAAERADPIGDDAHSPTPGLVHRYPDRVLLKIVSACPVYCRFCFRRETVGEGKGAMRERDLAAALDYVAAHPEIVEAILSGGDPLALAPRRLGDIIARVSRIGHVRTLRVHTRVPVALPDRIDAAMVAALRSAKPLFVALHANHPRELSAAARAACARLIDAGVPMVSQSVLLAGVNDDADTLAELMLAFLECRIKPYYLHHPDRAPGTAQFRLPLERGRALVAAMNAKLPGLARPTYVLDLPGGFGKASVAASRAEPLGPGRWRIIDREGRARLYEDEPDGA